MIPENFDSKDIRSAIAEFEISPSVEPNARIDLERVYFPQGHRGVLDMKRQLVVGNRGMGKSFWSHALTNPAVLARVAQAYSFPILTKTRVVLGFNGSIKLSEVTPTIDEIQNAHKNGDSADLIWRAVILRAVQATRSSSLPAANLKEALDLLKANPSAYAEGLTKLDDANCEDGAYTLIMFDALDRLGQDWSSIRELTKGLLVTVLGLQSFRSIRSKIFMRADQFADPELFHFPDSSKLRNDRVDLGWQPYELYGLLLFELLRNSEAAKALRTLGDALKASSALPREGRSDIDLPNQQLLIKGIAGEFMGTNAKRGRVYTWVPLHLSDADNNCSPRTFLTAWKTAAEHVPIPQSYAIDHLGLIEGVRRASNARLTELSEDYPWIKIALAPLRHHLVPIEKTSLFSLWQESAAITKILEQASASEYLVPIGIDLENSPDALLKTMASIAVMEIRANGKINVPDIFRVEAEILRKGGVAVPRKN